MPQIVSHDSVKGTEVRRTLKDGGVGAMNTHFLKSSAEHPDMPAAYFVDYPPGVTSGTHFHIADQFQIVMQGEGDFGRHRVKPYYVHFSRAFTPYGPLHAEQGWRFLTLRTRWDPGAQRLADRRHVLEAMPDRKPWQISRYAGFDTEGTATAGVKLDAIPDMQDRNGLCAACLSMAPDARAVTPDPSQSNGQYLVVLKGSLVHEQTEYPAVTVVFVKPTEASMTIQAGADGLEALVLNFPMTADAR